LNLPGMKPWFLSPWHIIILIKLSQLQIDSYYIPKLHRICIFLYSDLFFQHLFSHMHNCWFCMSVILIWQIEIHPWKENWFHCHPFPWCSHLLLKWCAQV
jgi:hypothetical protein